MLTRTEVRYCGATTAAEWHRAYQARGFNALLPKSLNDEGIPRKLEVDLHEQIRCLKKNYPRMTVADIHRKPLADGSIHIGLVSPSQLWNVLSAASVTKRT